MTIRLRRVYDAPDPSDGRRILVDRLWPRGLSRPNIRVDLWLPDAAPSTELRRWFGHNPARWREFQRRYKSELAGKPDLLAYLRQEARGRPITLVYAARDREHNNALVLHASIMRHASPAGNRGRPRSSSRQSSRSQRH